MDENIERLSELVREPQLTMIGAPPTINAEAFAQQLLGGAIFYSGAHLRGVELHANNKAVEYREKRFLFNLQNVFAFNYDDDDPICSEAREYDYCMWSIKENYSRDLKASVIVLADFTKNAYNTPADLSSFTGNARLVYTADAVLAMQKFQNAIRVSCLKAPWNNYAAWKEPLIDFFVEYEPESRAFHEVPAPEVSPLEDLNHINTRKRSARK